MFAYVSIIYSILHTTDLNSKNVLNVKHKYMTCMELNGCEPLDKVYCYQCRVKYYDPFRNVCDLLIKPYVLYKDNQ